MTRIVFMELTRQRSVPLYDYTFENWEDDKKALDLLRPEIEKSGVDTPVDAGRLQAGDRPGRRRSNRPVYHPTFRFSRSVSVSCNSDLM